MDALAGRDKVSAGNPGARIAPMSEVIIHVPMNRTLSMLIFSIDNVITAGHICFYADGSNTGVAE